MIRSVFAALVGVAAFLPSSGIASPCNPTSIATTKCAGKTYVYEQLAGFGRVPSNARDKFGDTLGGFGSAIAIDPKSWTVHSDGSFTGTLWGVPDRGWYVCPPARV
jgi:hypothetical protein